MVRELGASKEADPSMGIDHRSFPRFLGPLPCARLAAEGTRAPSGHPFPVPEA